MIALVSGLYMLLSYCAMVMVSVWRQNILYINLKGVIQPLKPKSATQMLLDQSEQNLFCFSYLIGFKLNTMF